MDEARLREIDQNIANEHEKIRETEKKAEALRKNRNFLESLFLKEAGRADCVRMLFYVAAKSKLEEIRFVRPEERQVAKEINAGMERSPKNVFGDYYKEYYPVFDMGLALPTPLKNRVIDAIVLLTQEATQYRGMKLPSLDDFWNTVRAGSKEEDWAEFDKNAEKLLNFFKKENTRLLAEIGELSKNVETLNRSITALKTEKKAMRFADKYAYLREQAERLKPGSWDEILDGIGGLNQENLITKAREEVAKLEDALRRTAKREASVHAIRELATHLSNSKYRDIREGAGRLKKALEEDRSHPLTDEELSAMEEEARTLRIRDSSRDKLKKRLDEEWVELKKNCRIATEGFKKWGASNNLQDSVKKLKDALATQAYSDELLERMTKLSEETEGWQTQLNELDNIEKNSSLADLGPLKTLILRIIEKRKLDGLEQIVRMLKWIVKHENKIGKENLPRLLGSITEKIRRKDYPGVIAEVNHYKDKSERERDSGIDRLKEKLGLKDLSDYAILKRVGGLIDSIKEAGIATLIKKGSLYYPPKHNHNLLGAKRRLQMLFFDTNRIMKPTKLSIELKDTDQKRLEEIMSLYTRIGERNEMLRAAAGEEHKKS